MTLEDKTASTRPCCCSASRTSWLMRPPAVAARPQKQSCTAGTACGYTVVLSLLLCPTAPRAEPCRTALGAGPLLSSLATPPCRRTRQGACRSSKTKHLGLIVRPVLVGVQEIAALGAAQNATARGGGWREQEPGVHLTGLQQAAQALAAQGYAGQASRGSRRWPVHGMIVSMRRAGAAGDQHAAQPHLARLAATTSPRVMRPFRSASTAAAIKPTPSHSWPCKRQARVGREGWAGMLGRAAESAADGLVQEAAVPSQAHCHASMAIERHRAAQQPRPQPSLRGPPFSGQATGNRPGQRRRRRQTRQALAQRPAARPRRC